MIRSTLSRILLICSLCIVLSTARAQYVAIPDSNFGKWLHNNGYSCLIGNSVIGFHLRLVLSPTERSLREWIGDNTDHKGNRLRSFINMI